MSLLIDAVSSNDRLTSLISLRDKIASTIDTTDSGRDIAALSKRLIEVMNEIDEIEQSRVVEDSPISRRKAKLNA